MRAIVADGEVNGSLKECSGFRILSWSMWLRVAMQFITWASTFDLVCITVSFSKSLGLKLEMAHHPLCVFDRNSAERPCTLEMMRGRGRRPLRPLAWLGGFYVSALMCTTFAFINPPRSGRRTGGSGMMRADWGCIRNAL